MKTVLILAAAATLGVAATAPAVLAQTVATSGDQAASQLELLAQAPSACVLSPPSAASGANASFTAQGGQAGVVRFTQFVDPQTAQPRDSSISLAFPLVCNSAHRLVVRTDGTGLSRTAGAAPAAGFRDSLDFQVTANWAGASASGASTALTPIDLATANGAAGQMNLVVAVAGGGAPMVAGDYAGTLVVELEAAN
ncbi:hypothetical protein [Caulobacter hibisci]|uniref:Spore coat protein U domain-containing protein n=1 Tax=Caulobacter hibisci TaxID=2035993 RepID=A0ABS0SXG4_9CAUL|nr:hypothetical protein [Caulobacter hibisci]MBI1684320.1 hypothetical protein [Caulobacter hibisci]